MIITVNELKSDLERYLEVVGDEEKWFITRKITGTLKEIKGQSANRPRLSPFPAGKTSAYAGSGLKYSAIHNRSLPTTEVFQCRASHRD